MKKHIGIDVHVVDGIFQGSRTHVLELFSRVIAISPEVEFFLFLDKSERLKKFSSAFTSPNVHFVHMPPANPVKRLCWQLPLLQRRYALDLLHTQYIMPFPSLSQCIVTIHDILFETHPKYFTQMFRLRSKVLMRLSAFSAAHIFTVSEYSKKEIMSNYGVKPERVSVIHNAVDTKKFFPGDAGRQIIEKRGLFSREYLLSVGRLEPRKNHISLLKAYAKLEDIAPPLVIIGQRHFGFNKLFEMRDALGLKNRVRFLEDVSDDELPAIYRHAKLFVYSAVAEGFGIPILEAMASGVPVISSNTTSMLEVAGDAAILVDPSDVASLETGIKRVLNDESLQHVLAEKGLANSASFRWDISAAKVREIYQKLL